MLSIPTTNLICLRCGSNNVTEYLNITPSGQTAIYRLKCNDCSRAMTKLISSQDPDPVQTHEDFYKEWNNGDLNANSWIEL